VGTSLIVRAAKLAAVVIPLAALALTVGAMPALAANIALVNTATATASATSITVSVPSGVSNGNVMLAQIGFKGGNSVTVTDPSGWTFIRQENGNSTGIGVRLYYRVASSEPASYKWTFSASEAATAGIAAYSGVSTTNPIDASSGAGSSANGTSITAPAVTTTAPNDMVVGFFSTGKNQVITQPSGMTEHWDVTPGSAIESETADVLQASAGSSGSKTATVSGSASWVGQLVALLPACAGGSLSMSVPSSTSFSSLTLNGTNQTTTTTVQLTPDDETGTWPGWNITGTSTTFSDGIGHSLSTTATATTGASSSAATGNCALPTNSVTYPVTLPAASTPPTAVKLYNAASGTGKGPTNVTLTFQLSVPANSFRGTYTSTWTFAVVSGP